MTNNTILNFILIDASKLTEEDYKLVRNIGLLFLLAIICFVAFVILNRREKRKKKNKPLYFDPNVKWTDVRKGIKFTGLKPNVIINENQKEDLKQIADYFHANNIQTKSNFNKLKKEASKKSGIDIEQFMDFEEALINVKQMKDGTQIINEFSIEGTGSYSKSDFKSII